MSIETSRRGLLIGLGALVAAPAIVRASSLMAVKPIDKVMLNVPNRIYCLNPDDTTMDWGADLNEDTFSKIVVNTLRRNHKFLMKDYNGT
jgi:hypothetical protein